MISTHILDTCLGVPATDVEVKLEKFEFEKWKSIDINKTNKDGRIVFNCQPVPGVYRLVFELDNYFERVKQEHFFVRTPVVFKINDTARKYHVPLLLNPYGYSTYRGS